MNVILSLVLVQLVVSAVADDQCFFLGKDPVSPLQESPQKCMIEVIYGNTCAGLVDVGRVGGDVQCVDVEDSTLFSCICEDQFCPTTAADMQKELQEQISVLEAFYGPHPLRDCVFSAVVHFPSKASGDAAESTTGAGLSPPTTSEGSTAGLPSSTLSRRPSTSPPSSSSAVPGSSPSEQTTAQEPLTSEQVTDSTSPSQPAVVESSTVDEALEEITSKHPFQSAATTLENNDSTMPFSTSTMTTGAEWEADADRPTDLTWLYISLGILLALVLMVAIGGLGFKLGKKSDNDTKQKIERKSKQIQQGPMKGVVPRQTDVRINMPEAAPSTPVVETNLPMTDTTTPISQHTGTSGTSGTSNTDEDLNTAGSTITECEISTSTTMTEEMTGGSGTSGL